MSLKESQRSLRAWTKQDWGTKSGKKSSETGERYLPKKAIASLSDSEYASTTRAKRKGTKAGKQHVAQPDKIKRKTRQFRYTGGPAGVTQAPPEFLQEIGEYSKAEPYNPLAEKLQKDFDKSKKIKDVAMMGASPVSKAKVATKVFPNFSIEKLKDISYNAPRLFIYKKSNRKYPDIVDKKGNKYDEVLFKTSFVKRIPIDDYLKLTTPSDKAIKNITTTPRIKSYGNFDVKKATDKNSIGPFLQIDEAGKVVGHEGRTRAILAKQAGAKTMPVEIKLQRYSKNKKDFEEIAQKFHDKTKKLPEDLKDLDITKLKPQSFKGEVRKDYTYKINKN